MCQTKQEDVTTSIFAVQFSFCESIVTYFAISALYLL